MCTERDTGRFYIGYGFKNYLPAEQDFGNRYFTSNKYVMKNFDRFDWKIIAEFYENNEIRYVYSTFNKSYEETIEEMKIYKDDRKKLNYWMFQKN